MTRRWLLALAASACCLPALATDLFAPGSDNDPRVRGADFLGADQRYFSAASELLTIQDEQPQRRLPPEFYRRLAAYTLSFGMQERAAAIDRELAATTLDPVALARERIRLAEFLYQRGYEEQAVADLRAMRDSLPPKLLVPWQDTLARALMAQGRYGEAIDVLTALNNSGQQSAYTRYNLGVALINDGRAGQGVNVLDRVGRIGVRDAETLALRDKANLSLGYHYLRQQQGGTAIPLFERVRNEGPSSNRALLGLGWAYLAPQGTKQKKTELGDEVPNELETFKTFSTIGVLLRPGFLDKDIYRRAGLRPFRLTRANAGEEAALKRALVPWVELVGRDTMDPAVQEGLLAIPYTLDRLGAHIQAQQYYERAITALEAARKHLDETAEYVRSGRMIHSMVKRTADAESGWTWELKDLPDAQETFYLQGLVATNRFQEQLKNFRDVQLMQRNLDSWTARLAELQAGFIERENAPTRPVAQLIEQALHRRPPTTPAPAAAPPAADTAAPDAPTPQLELDSSLAVRDSGAKATAAAAPPLALQLAPPPAAQNFDGTWERMQALKTRIAAAQPKLAAAGTEQSRLLESVALAELANQRQQTEKYLVEARFALARIYDRQLKGDGK